MKVSLRTAVFQLFLITLIPSTFATSPKIDPNLRDTLKSAGRANILIQILFDKSFTLSPAFKIADRVERINHVMSVLKTETLLAQKPVIELLQSLEVPFKSYWISNQIYIQNVKLDLVENLLQFKEIEGIYEDLRVELAIQIPEISVVADNVTNWNILDVKATEVWHITNGTGVVVGSIDTGVRVTHKALYRNYVGERGWFDPYDFTEIPFDEMPGSGTHIMGTIVGQEGIGVAPGAQWLACRGCAGFGCGNGEIMACGQFMLAPTLPDGSDPDPSKAPHMVSNSWTGGQGDHIYDALFDAWNAAGIIPFFPTGGRGPGCFETSSPGDNERVISTGSTQEDGTLSDRSSKGPTVEGLIKPEVVAPGDLILSASYLGDDNLELLSGTSMANAHTVGIAALIKSIDPTINTLDEFKTLITSGAAQDVPTTGMNCGGIDEETYPNNAVGWGKVDAYETVLGVQRKRQQYQ